jgi:hypothetical protein
MNEPKMAIALRNSVKTTAVTMLLVLSLLCQNALAKGNTTKKYSYDSKTFDVSVSQLPAHYSGNNPVAVYEKAKHAFVAKTEFETSEEYNARFIKATESLGLYAFLRLPNMANEREKIRYDAESEAFIVMIPVLLGLDEVVFITQISGEKGTYIGQNAFGAKIRVSKRDATRYIVNFGSKLERDLASAIIFKIPVPRDKAKRLKDSIKVLYIGAPSETYQSTTRLIPEIDDPRDMNMTICWLTMWLKAIWVYNYNTGEILDKKDY